MNTWEEIFELCEFHNEFIINSKNNIDKKDIAFILFSKKPKYKEYKIPKKKAGAFRSIESPNSKLKALQKIIKTCIEICFIPKQATHGFVRERSIVTNAKQHVGRKYVYNIDLENFFPTIHFGRIKGVFQASPFNFSEQVSQHLANICCNDAGSLPQGAPTSPILSNLVCRSLDRKLSELANKNKVKFTRYADDITFSSNFNIFDNNFFDKLKKTIEQERFSINLHKVRLQSQLQRQEVTGITVNKKTNVTRIYMSNLRFLVKIYSNNIEESQKWLERHYTNRHRYNGKVPKIEEVIQGKLDFLKMVVGEDREKYKAISLKFQATRNGENINTKNLEERKGKIEKSIKNLQSKGNEKETAEYLLESKMIIHENTRYHSKEIHGLIKIFEEKTKDDTNIFLAHNLLQKNIKDPIKLIDVYINQEINPIENRKNSETERPEHLIAVLKKFRVNLHPFGQLMHTNEIDFEIVRSESMKEFDLIGKPIGGVQRKIPIEIYGALKRFLAILNSDNNTLRYKGKPYSIFFKENEELLEGFKRCFRFGNGTKDVKISNIIDNCITNSIGDKLKIWYIDIQNNIDEIFKNILTSTKNIAFAVEKIINSCNKYSSIGAVKFEATRWNNRVVFRIINLGINHRDVYASTFFNDIGGDLKVLQSLLKGYCDLNIRSTFKDEQHSKISLLPVNGQLLPSEKYIPQGFTYELIFYRPIKFLLVDDGDQKQRILKAKKILNNIPNAENLLEIHTNIVSDIIYLEDYDAIFIHTSNQEYENMVSKLIALNIPCIAFSGEKYYDKINDRFFYLNDSQFYDNLENYLLLVENNTELSFTFWESKFSESNDLKTQTISDFVESIHYLVSKNGYHPEAIDKIRQFIGQDIDIPFLTPKKLESFINSKKNK